MKNRLEHILKWRNKLVAIFKAEKMCLIELNPDERDFLNNIFNQLTKDDKILSIQQSIWLNKIYGRID